MQIPQIIKIMVLIHNVPFSNLHSTSLALEIILGQKVFSTITGNVQKQNWKGHGGDRAKQANNFARGFGNATRGALSFNNSMMLCCSLRGRRMYSFLEKLISLRLPSLSETAYKCKILGPEVQLTFSTREVRIFPEIQNHFEFFDSLKTIQISVVTSANNERETRLLWAGLSQSQRK